MFLILDAKTCSSKQIGWWCLRKSVACSGVHKSTQHGGTLSRRWGRDHQGPRWQWPTVCWDFPSQVIGSITTVQLCTKSSAAPAVDPWLLHDPWGPGPSAPAASLVKFLKHDLKKTQQALTGLDGFVALGLTAFLRSRCWQRRVFNQSDGPGRVAKVPIASNCPVHSTFPAQLGWHFCFTMTSTTSLKKN